MDTAKVKYNLGRQVCFGGKLYTLTACIMRQGSSGFRFQAELKDNTAESALVIADLRDITEAEEKLKC